ncbi:MAG: hypothetical protein HXY24_04560 [Rubrivivax sp.]|nr:hypothetical protein [Rubrivivax sp.]
MKPATMIACATCAAALTATTSALAQDADWTADRIKSEWVGKKVFSRGASGQLADLWLKEDGGAEVSLANGFSDAGKWRLSDTGFCTKWQKIRNGEERCFTVRNRMGQVQVINPDGSLNSTVIRVQ